MVELDGNPKANDYNYSDNFETNIHIKSDLELLNKSVNYRKWLFQIIKPFLGERILEAGSGIGNYTEKMLGKESIWATDIDPLYFNHLRNRFKKNPEVNTMILDISNVTPDVIKFFLTEKIDTIVVLNVLEHIEKDMETVRNLQQCLPASGRIILVVPALQRLLSPLDKAYGHFRRYSKKDIRKIADNVEMELEECKYFNFIGIFGWLYFAMIKKKVNLPTLQTRVFDYVVPFVSMIENIIRPRIGLSLLAVLQKKIPRHIEREN